MTDRSRQLAKWSLSLCALIVVAGCKSSPRNYDAIRAYYRYDFTAAREALRSDAMTKDDEQTILNNVRLGMASLADGDLHEAEIALGRSFDLLSTAGLNKDRTVAAVLDHEGVKIWKGEPFEQALTYYYVAALYAELGDWENVRAAAANSLFRLTDFGKDQTAQKLTKNAAKDPEYLNTYTATDTNFALGFLMQGVGSALSGAPGSDDLYTEAAKINPSLEEIVSTLRSGQFNTLVIVDYGKGPIKTAYGPDEALVRFVPRDRTFGDVVISTESSDLMRQPAVCDVNNMAEDHRWNNLEDVRKAKSAIGDILLLGGAITTGYGASRNDGGAALVGLGAVALGLLTKAGAKGDTRYCEFMPAAIYVVPVTLNEPADLRVSVDGDPTAVTVISNVQPGTQRNPSVVYVRLLGRESPIQPAWLTRSQPIIGNDFTGVREADYPWILGGQDVSTPSRDVVDAYAAGGNLPAMNAGELRGLYDAEAIFIGAGMAPTASKNRNASFRHILEGGDGLFTPYPYSMGYKRLMFQRHGAYDPLSDAVWNLAEQIRVEHEQQAQSTENLEETPPRIVSPFASHFWSLPWQHSVAASAVRLTFRPAPAWAIPCPRR